MTPANSVRSSAKQEFEWAFGEVIREIDEPGEDVFYQYFLGEFLTGVEHGIDCPDETAEAFQVEAALRYILDPAEDFKALEPESRAATGRGSGLVFLYGAHWARTAAQEHNQH